MSTLRARLAPNKKHQETLREKNLSNQVIIISCALCGEMSSCLIICHCDGVDSWNIHKIRIV